MTRKPYPKWVKIIFYVCGFYIVVFFGYGMIFVPAELKCATAYFVAPGNVEKACAQFEENQ